MHINVANPKVDYFPLLELRKNMYILLQKLLSQPLSKNDYIQIKSNGNLDVIKDFGEGGEIIYNFFTVDNGTNPSVHEQEYYKLFIGPGTLLAPPWESVYRGRDRILYDYPSLEVAKIYDSFGLELIERNIEAEDHLVIELEFMIHLIESSSKENGIVSRFIDGQDLMLSQHLSKWIPGFTRDVLDNTESTLYRGLALLLNDFISFDTAYIKELSLQEIR